MFYLVLVSTLNNLFHLKTRHNSLTKKIELEKLYKQITNEANKIDDEERLRCEVKRFGLKVPGCRDKDVLTNEQYGLIKTFTSRDDITVRKSDKSKTCVSMDSTDYEAKLSLIVGDTTKFSRIDEDSSETLKKKLINLIDAANLSTNDLQFSKLVVTLNP